MNADEESEDELASAGIAERATSTGTNSSAAILCVQRSRNNRLDEQETKNRQQSREKSLAIVLPGPSKPWEYQRYDHSTTVDEILEELEGSQGQRSYRIQFEDGSTEILSPDHLSRMRNGDFALRRFQAGTNQYGEALESDDQLSMASLRRKRSRTTRNHSDQTETNHDASSSDEGDFKRQRTTNHGMRRSRRAASRSARSGNIYHEDKEDTSEDERPTRRSTRHSSRVPLSKTRLARSVSVKSATEHRNDESAGEVQETDESEVEFEPRPRHRRRRKRPAKKTARPSKFALSADENDDDDSSDDEPSKPIRKSGRTNQARKSMREQGLDEELYAEEQPIVSTASKVVSVREIFQPLLENNPFRALHSNSCDVCAGQGTHSNKGTSPLIYCQGCSTSIHKVCLGYRSGREHMVTKVDEDNFVMQCRRCIGIAMKKDSSAPRLDICQTCKEPGLGCAAFSTKKTSKQEEKLREENDGKDPITQVSLHLLDNAGNLLFRCRACQRAYHFHHLPALGRKSKVAESQAQITERRLSEYSPSFQCRECRQQEAKIHVMVAWRPVDQESYEEGYTADMFREDEKEYLIKWEEQSYDNSTWMPGAWVWGVTAATMRNAFLRRDDGANLLPKWTKEDAIPEDYITIEIIFDVDYQSGFETKSEKADKAKIGKVEKVLVKYKGLGYEDTVWQDPPDPEDKDLWTAFVSAYNEYVAGKYFKQRLGSDMRRDIETFRDLDFEDAVDVNRQPSALEGGELMPYQKSGMNWLLENYHKEKNVILADEMGLGKTIQIISMIASLVKDSPQCWPFLVVTPNSTCPNWRRELKKWAPSIRVVAYYGGRVARDMAMKYELYPGGCKEMRAHVVVTSYEAPVDDRAFFRKIKWAGMVIDEGQRLKNDANQLYTALTSLRVPFRVLLTGTPLQNNLRELFNLLQFLDPSQNAKDLEEEYEDLTNDKIKEVQTLIEPFFLRRTKLQVLKFLPPMGQMIVPVSMSVLQKKLCKSIMAKNPALIKSIFGQTNKALRPQERGNLNNILMQLRKVLCHPFMFSSAIEEEAIPEVMERQLIEASSKLQLLEIMLPKLKDRGHRVLIFSQFLNQLDIIEDFLNSLDLPFRRLDGTISALEKQKRIDAFNHPDSDLFAFLLSTRAGGVGINLATADTVIIMDPDYNPHQDIQALSRAHRIGQKKKVLVFQLMTKDSAEEKITQIGRKKMSLDHALIETMGVETEVPIDLESILKHGAEALFNDDDSADIRYDSASVDKLLDRATIENTTTDDDKTAESAFSHARVWTQKGELEDIGDSDVELSAPDASVWEKILKQREADAAAEAAKNMVTLGRGKRVRQAVDYQKSEIDDALATSPVKMHGRRKKNGDVESDTEFAAAGESEEDEEDDPEHVDVNELQSGRPRTNSLGKGTRKNPSSGKAKLVKPAPPSSATRIRTTKLEAKSSTKSKTKKGASKSTAPAKSPAAQKSANSAPVQGGIGKTKQKEKRIPASQAKGSKALTKSNKTPRSKKSGPSTIKTNASEHTETENKVALEQSCSKLERVKTSPAAEGVQESSSTSLVPDKVD
ncbi:hypothetical protein BP6252_13441 [Coleophoma cylindrospora]|uniref:Chromatin remodeling factor mit1 n=1 Tax=Coleophoma cylindrospora TaxID=1849047 RepID=A0A3D8Q8N0_9HELO|nr:hypothetical protein BP6252_13441 [Coleophoma cylindrospora]